MPRVKRGRVRAQKRSRLLKKTKGYNWGRKNLPKLASMAVKKAGQHAFMDRRKKKRTNRRLWAIKLNAALRENGTTYSKFIFALKKNNVILDRKVLADIAEFNPEIFKKIVESLK